MDGFDDYDMPVIINVKPEDQLDLGAEELEKEVRGLRFNFLMF